MSNKLDHVAIIMDGNGRWAQKQKQKRTFGHYQGASQVRDIAIAAQDLGIKVLTLYAFSTENWSRPLEEVNYLMKLPGIFFDKFMKELMERQIKIELIGRRNRIPKATMNVLNRAMEQSKDNTGMKLVFAMDYGSRDEITQAFRAYADEVKTNIRENDLLEEEVSNYLFTKELGDVDLLIRTSLDYRLSNYLLWQCAYAEFIFTETPWPAFTKETLSHCIEEYKHRQRRFGGLNEE